VAWWPGEGNANDIAGTNNGVLVGGATCAPGLVGQAFSLNGGTQYVAIADGPALRPASLTIEGWFNFGATDGILSLVNKTYGSGGLNSYIFWYQSGALYGALTTPAGASAYLEYVWTPGLGTWHHIAYTFDDGTHTQALYLDGVEVASSVVSGSIVYDAHPVLIGEEIEYERLVYPFTGQIDEVSFYNRALALNEVAAIYDAGSAGKCGFPRITRQPGGQIGYWGKSITFTVGAVGVSPLTYQWQKESVPISGATGPSLVLTNLQMTNAGNYSVVISNSLGSTTSGNAFLTMNPAGVSLALYAGVTIDGVVGLTYGIQSNTDLSNTNGWRGVANVTLDTPNELWFDVQPATQPQRYYRVVPGPIPIP
jgi:hypothetical protein